jgi:hypothetical protein
VLKGVCQSLFQEVFEADMIRFYNESLSLEVMPSFLDNSQQCHEFLFVHGQLLIFNAKGPYSDMLLACGLASKLLQLLCLKRQFQAQRLLKIR